MLKIQSNFSVPIIPHPQAYPKYFKMKEKNLQSSILDRVKAQEGGPL